MRWDNMGQHALTTYTRRLRFSHSLLHLLSIHQLQPPVLTTQYIYSHTLQPRTQTQNKPSLPTVEMEHFNQDQITMRSEKRVDFSILESDPDTDSSMSGSDFEETSGRSRGRQFKFVPEQLTEEHIITTIETRPARAIRIPKSRIAKAVQSRHAATDASVTPSGAQIGNPAPRPRARASTPKPERASKRKRGLEPSNQGLPMDTASTPKRARKYTVPCKAPNAAGVEMDAGMGSTVVQKEEAPVAIMSAPAIKQADVPASFTNPK